MEPRETEDIVHRALRALPPPRAPQTLLPRVMAAVADRPTLPLSGPASRPWFAWPVAWQAASIAALVLLSTGIIWVWPAAWDLVATSSAGAWNVARPRVLNLVTSASAAATLGTIVWDVFLRPIVGYLMVWIVLMSVACTAFGAAIGRVALGGASQS
jgi:hypothetical protein